MQAILKNVKPFRFYFRQRSLFDPSVDANIAIISLTKSS